jgi:ricin-type beta-trefoil lectin protein
MNAKTAWLGTSIGAALTVMLFAASAQDSAAAGPTARAAAICGPGSHGRIVNQLGDMVTISSNTSSASSPGKYLRVSARNFATGPLNPAVLALPASAAAQHWHVEAAPRLAGVPVFPAEFIRCAFRLRNSQANGCLTASQAHAAPAFVGRCTGSISQAWFYTDRGQIGSLNFTVGGPKYTLDIPNYHNDVGTRLVVANVANTWNQSWRMEQLPASP